MAAYQVPPDLQDSVIIADGFYRDPGVVRELAMKAEFKDYGPQSSFAGRESLKAFYTSELVEQLAALVRVRRIDYDPQKWVFGKFRLAYEGDRGATIVHVDKVDWTVVVYLSSASAPGTEGQLMFYQHRETALAEVPLENLVEYGVTSEREFDEKFILPQSNDLSRWAVRFTVPYVYNRCVAFRGRRLFHGVENGFGIGRYHGRLTQNFFFNQKGLEDTVSSSRL